LIRFALVPHGSGRRRRAVIDTNGTMPGRGAYLCRAPHDSVPAAECLELAIRRGGIARTLRCAVTIDLEHEHLESIVR
jgi:predicted RNA-binding protein YlxR (DUF448 family)